MLKFGTQLQIDLLPDEQLDNQFEVILPSLNLDGINQGNFLGLLAEGPYSYAPIVEEITFGVRNFKSDTRRQRTGWVNIPSDIDDSLEASLVMFCSTAMLTQRYLSIWKELVFNSVHEYYGNPAEYKKNIEIFFYGTGNFKGMEPIARYTLNGCYPAVQDPFVLKYSDDPQRLRIKQSFKVDYVTTDVTYGSAAMLSEILMAPGDMANDAISQTLSSLNSLI